MLRGHDRVDPSGCLKTAPPAGPASHPVAALQGSPWGPMTRGTGHPVRQRLNLNTQQYNIIFIF